MAQTGYTPIQLYYSSTTTNAPLAANLAYGELAINITDGKLFYKDNANAIQVIGWKVVPATAGGTGQTSYAVGDLIYADTTTSLAKLPDVATGNALISGGVSTAPSWGKIGLTTHVSGTLGVGNGGTGATTLTANYFLQGNGASAISSSTKLYTDGTNVFSDCSYRPQVQSGATNNTAPTALTVSNKTTGAEAAGLGAALEFQYVGSGGGYSGGKIAGVALGDPFTADIVFYPRNYGYAEALRIKSTGDTSFTGGNLIQGTAAKGINFTANTPASGMTSQLLNWYEQGTYTVALYDAASGGNASATTVTGYYTRVGNLVTCSFSGLNAISTAGMTAGNTLYISLPFTASSTGTGTGSFACENIAFGALRTNAIPVALNSNSRAIFRAYGSGVSSASLIVSNITSGSANIDYFTLTYRA